MNTPASASKPKDKLSKMDSQFLRDALESGRRENDKARAALSQGSSQKVKDFAKVLMEDHSAESNKLVAMATKSGFSDFLSMTKDYFTARSEVDARTGDKRNPGENEISRLHGAAFDKEFGNQITADLQARISKFEAAQSSVANADLREFVTSTLPKLREHLTTSQSLNK